MTRLGLITISTLITLGLTLIFGGPALVFLAGSLVGMVVGAFVTVFVVVFRR